MFGINLGSALGKICEELGAPKGVEDVLKTIGDGASVGLDLASGNYMGAVEDGYALVRDGVDDVKHMRGDYSPTCGNGDVSYWVNFIHQHGMAAFRDQVANGAIPDSVLNDPKFTRAIALAESADKAKNEIVADFDHEQNSAASGFYQNMRG